jgi:hypothetical protein
MLFPQNDRHLNFLSGIWEATNSDLGRKNLTRDLVIPTDNVGVAPNIRPQLLYYTFLAIRYVRMIIPVDDLIRHREKPFNKKKIRKELNKQMYLWFYKPQSNIYSFVDVPAT